MENTFLHKKTQALRALLKCSVQIIMLLSFSVANAKNAYVQTAGWLSAIDSVGVENERTLDVIDVKTVQQQSQEVKRGKSVLDGVPSELFVMKLDTLSLKERFLFRTNTIDWALMIPNVAVEFDLLPYNWSKWTVGLSGRFNGNAKNTFNPYYVYNVNEIKAEVRRYWHTTYRRDQRIGVKKPFSTQWSSIRQMLSRQRMNPRMEKRAYYAGAFVSYTDFSIKLGSEGKQGTAMTGGFTIGFQQPLYGYGNGSTLDFELGLSAGVAMLEYDLYKYDRDFSCYPVTGHVDKEIRPVISEIRAAFVYRMGRASDNRYWHRTEVDEIYMARWDSIIMAREKEKSDRITLQTEKERRDAEIADSIQREKNKEIALRAYGRGEEYTGEKVTADIIEWYFKNNDVEEWPGIALYDNGKFYHETGLGKWARFNDNSDESVTLLGEKADVNVSDENGGIVLITKRDSAYAAYLKERLRIWHSLRRGITLDADSVSSVPTDSLDAKGAKKSKKAKKQKASKKKDKKKNKSESENNEDSATVEAAAEPAEKEGEENAAPSSPGEEEQEGGEQS